MGIVRRHSGGRSRLFPQDRFERSLRRVPLSFTVVHGRWITISAAGLCSRRFVPAADLDPVRLPSSWAGLPGRLPTLRP